jgi:hypothetical protein
MAVSRTFQPASTEACTASATAASVASSSAPKYVPTPSDDSTTHGLLRTRCPGVRYSPSRCGSRRKWPSAAPACAAAKLRVASSLQLPPHGVLKLGRGCRARGRHPAPVPQEAAHDASMKPGFSSHSPASAHSAHCGTLSVHGAATVFSA